MQLEVRKLLVMKKKIKVMVMAAKMSNVLSSDSLIRMFNLKCLFPNNFVTSRIIFNTINSRHLPIIDKIKMIIICQLMLMLLFVMLLLPMLQVYQT